ncbi:MAG: DEAD/DEAH box helicase, partial [Polyangiales bacterium]
AARLAVVNGGTIADRGLYGVFLVGSGATGAKGETAKRVSRRVGELDEEMVFESRVGEVFLLGASSWRIEEITHDQVLVSPAPGEPGKMPFWHGDRPGRPVAFGQAIGALARTLVKSGRVKADASLRAHHGFDERAAKNLVEYLFEQADATGVVPSDQTIVVERFVDEIGDHRVCVLSPFGARVHAPWATAVTARLEARFAGEIDSIWSDDGMVFRLPESDTPPDVQLFLPTPAEIEDLVIKNVSATSLFSARFRECAARSLLLPRRHPTKRTPLWAQRKRAADLLAVASRHGSFPIVLETYREVLRDVFDLPSLVETLRRIEQRRIRVVTVDSAIPSPYASSLLFSYVANFIYDGDSPLAERRAQVLGIDHAQLRELLGEAELRELLDPEAIEEHERTLQRIPDAQGRYALRSADALHDLLLSIGDLSAEEIAHRVMPGVPAGGLIDQLESERRIVAIRIARDTRYIAAEDAARYRDALGIVPPAGLPRAFLESTPDPLGELTARFARTHGPFIVETPAARFGIATGVVLAALERLMERGRVVQGEFLRGGRSREWCDAEVLRALRRKSLARLRKEVEPVTAAAFGRFLPEWQGIVGTSLDEVSPRRASFDALLTAIERLQAAPLPASVLETEILPARVPGYRP